MKRITLVLLAFAIVVWATSEASAATASKASTAVQVAAETTAWHGHGYRAYRGNYRLYRDYGPYTSYRYAYPPRYSVYRYGYARPYGVYRPYYGYRGYGYGGFGYGRFGYGGFGYRGPRVALRFGY